MSFCSLEPNRLNSTCTQLKARLKLGAYRNKKETLIEFRMVLGAARLGPDGAGVLAGAGAGGPVLPHAAGPPGTHRKGLALVRPQVHRPLRIPAGLHRLILFLHAVLSIYLANYIEFHRILGP